MTSQLFLAKISLLRKVACAVSEKMPNPNVFKQEMLEGANKIVKIVSITIQHKVISQYKSYHFPFLIVFEHPLNSTEVSKIHHFLSS